MVENQVDDNSQIFTLGNGWKSSFPSILNWLFGVPGCCFFVWRGVASSGAPPRWHPRNFTFQIHVVNVFHRNYTYKSTIYLYIYCSVRTVWKYIHIHIIACISVSTSMMFNMKPTTKGLVAAFRKKQTNILFLQHSHIKWEMGPSDLILCDHAPLTSPSRNMLNGCWSDDNPT